MQTNWIARTAYFLLRVVSGFLLVQTGGTIVFGWLGGIPAGSPESPLTQPGGWIEFVCGALVMIGFITRPAAFLLSGTMAVAYWKFHYKWGEPGTVWTWPSQNFGVAAVVLSFVFLLFFAQGGGMLSIDESIQLRKAKAKGVKV